MSNQTFINKSSVRNQRAAGASFSDGRRSSVMEKVHSAVSEILTRDEVIVYIAIQKKALVPIAPKCMVLTNRRVITYRSKILGGADFDDHLWREVKASKLNEGMMGSSFKIFTEDGKAICLDYLPRSQGRKLYSLTREMEQRLRSQGDPHGTMAWDGCARELDNPSPPSSRSNRKTKKSAQPSQRQRTAVRPRPKSKELRRAKQTAAV